MGSSAIYPVLILLTACIYLFASKYIFDNVFSTIKIVVDELFHIPQGMAYCHRNFARWDPKITTLPGLYFISSLFLGTYFECNTYNLRSVNLIASCINFVLLSFILNYIYGDRKKIVTVLQALNLTILPPLYFFSHVYYTDVLSITFLLLYFRLSFTNNHKFVILLSGFLSILMRQTNVIWVAMVFGHKVLDVLVKTSRVYGNRYVDPEMYVSRESLISNDINDSKLKRYYGVNDVYVALKYHLTTCFSTLFKLLTVQDFVIMITHFVILAMFVAFVYVNGAIVVGDKTAHTASIHIPQLFYFLIFYGVFGLPYVLSSVGATIPLILRNKLKVALMITMFLIVVHFNTVVHPYLLADNRHFTFYVWNRWYGKYAWAKYVSVPVYVFLVCNLYENLRHHNCITFLLPFSISCVLSMALQRMIEVRYFLVPFIILRLRFKTPSPLLVSLEFFWYLLINCGAFYVFFNKDVMWKDFDYVQKIIW